jgi:glutamyl-tRNA synthetase
VHDIERQARPYFPGAIAYDAEAADKQWKDRAASADLLAAARARLAALADWSAPAMETALRALADERGVGGGKVFQPLRVALTGMPVSPGIFEVLVAMGRELSLTRIDAAIDFLKRAS